MAYTNSVETESKHRTAVWFLHQLFVDGYFAKMIHKLQIIFKLELLEIENKDFPFRADFGIMDSLSLLYVKFLRLCTDMYWLFLVYTAIEKL